jgi:hypothetical protein
MLFSGIIAGYITQTHIDFSHRLINSLYTYTTFRKQLLSFSSFSAGMRVLTLTYSYALFMWVTVQYVLIVTCFMSFVLCCGLITRFTFFIIFCLFCCFAFYFVCSLFLYYFSPCIYRSYFFLFVYKFTDHCHRLETHLQLINIISLNGYILPEVESRCFRKAVCVCVCKTK